MLESTFPTCGIARLPDVDYNKSLLSALRSGKAHREATTREWWELMTRGYWEFFGGGPTTGRRLWELITGSMAEGLAMGYSLGCWWGHKSADVDVMSLYGAELGVCVPQKYQPAMQHKPLSRPVLSRSLYHVSRALSSPLFYHILMSLSSIPLYYISMSMTSLPLHYIPVLIPLYYNRIALPMMSSQLQYTLSSLWSFMGILGKSCLVYDPEGCPPAYTRLRVTDTRKLMDHHCVDVDCMLECDGQYWLLSTPLNEAIHRDLTQLWDYPALNSISISGPAGQAMGGLIDSVPTLVANEPHHAIEHYINRPRSTGWPSPDQLQQLQKLPMNFVLVGHKDSPRKNQEFRISWSTGELVLISPLPNHIKQGYIAFKYVMKNFLRNKRGQNETEDGRSKIGSYHLKTTFLYYLEKTPLSVIESPFCLMMDLFIYFSGYLNRGELPHYFLPECDLFATVGHDELQIALKSINEILLDPITAVLTCPSVPTEIYGNILPDELVSVFHRVSSLAYCERNREDLLRLLSHLDEWRQQAYHKYVGYDWREDCDRVSGQPELRGLVQGILEQTKHM